MRKDLVLRRDEILVRPRCGSNWTAARLLSLKSRHVEELTFHRKPRHHTY